MHHSHVEINKGIWVGGGVGGFRDASWNRSLRRENAILYSGIALKDDNEGPDRKARLGCSPPVVVETGSCVLAEAFRRLLKSGKQEPRVFLEGVSSIHQAVMHGIPFECRNPRKEVKMNGRTVICPQGDLAPGITVRRMPPN